MIKWLPSSTNCGPHGIFVCETTAETDDAPPDPPKGGLARLLSEASVADSSPIKMVKRSSAASLASFEAALSPWQRNQLASSLESSADLALFGPLVARRSGGSGLNIDEDLDEDLGEDGDDEADSKFSRSAPTFGSASMLRRDPSEEWGQFSRMREASSDSLAAEAKPPPQCTPDYVVAEPLENQVLWHRTAGRRPAQPPHERAVYEELYRKQLQSLSASSASLAEAEPRPPGTADVRWRAKNPFGGSSAQRSWRCACCEQVTNMSISIPQFQVRGKRAEFLVVAKIGSVRFGLWRTFSAFHRLADGIRHFDDHYHRLAGGAESMFSNTMVSWLCLRRRQRWFRCLDRDYLGVKCFLLERFLHDALFEAPHANIFSDFLEIKFDSKHSAPSPPLRVRLPQQ